MYYKWIRGVDDDDNDYKADLRVGKINEINANMPIGKEMELEDNIIKENKLHKDL